ncbi:hypothetical protein GCM10022204_06990 [Microlunatus aurantiacus]|uniref:PQ loop repeat-containing protein n=1 Tax=Microlunatus aurantiacus TaxID=446786 RepID=A0ABP7CRY4_9ACTN
MFVVALGWFAAALAATVALPQVVKLLRNRTTAGISLTAWRLTLAANIAWTGHGFVVGHANIWLPNLMFMICSVIILNQLRRDRVLTWGATFGPSLVLGLATLGLDVTYGALVFAIAAGLPSVIAQMLQFQELVVAPRISGVSLPFLAMNWVTQAAWLSWALLVGEQSITMVASTMGVLMGLNLLWAVLRRQGVVRARLAVLSA